MSDFRAVTDQVSVSPQIDLADVARAAQEGFKLIISNRPDGEDATQPAGAVIAEAAARAGLRYFAIPLGRDGVRDELIEATRQALDSIDGPVLAYCRSGTRSTTLWALSQAGRDVAGEIIAKAAGAGYDISHLRGHLDAGS